MITKEVLAKCLPHNKNIDQLHPIIDQMFEKYKINSKSRVAAFLAQCGHESNQFTVLKENLNYRSERLVAVFPKYFPTLSVAEQYGKNPEKIANKVYGGRMGNGPESSGDGYKFRGRGAIQLTGRNNYTAFAESIGKTVDEAAEYCETLAGAIESACWYWTINKLNEVADTHDMKVLTKKINGGTIGLEERTKYFNAILAVLAAEK